MRYSWMVGVAGWDDNVALPSFSCLGEERGEVGVGSVTSSGGGVRCCPHGISSQSHISLLIVGVDSWTSNGLAIRRPTPTSSANNRQHHGGESVLRGRRDNPWPNNPLGLLQFRNRNMHAWLENFIFIIFSRIFLITFPGSSAWII